MGSQRTGHDFFLSSIGESRREIHMRTRQVIYRRDHGAFIRHRDSLFIHCKKSRGERKKKKDKPLEASIKVNALLTVDRFHSQQQNSRFFETEQRPRGQSILTLLLQVSTALERHRGEVGIDTAGRVEGLPEGLMFTLTPAGQSS